MVWKRTISVWVSHLPSKVKITDPIGLFSRLHHRIQITWLVGCQSWSPWWVAPEVYSDSFTNSITLVWTEEAMLQQFLIANTYKWQFILIRRWVFYKKVLNMKYTSRDCFRDRVRRDLYPRIGRRKSVALEISRIAIASNSRNIPLNFPNQTSLCRFLDWV